MRKGEGGYMLFAVVRVGECVEKITRGSVEGLRRE